MNGALLAVAGLLVQSVVLGMGSSLVFRTLPDWRRVLPLWLTVAYYAAVLIWPPQAVRALRDGHAYPLTDALRYDLLVCAITAAVYLLSRRVRQLEQLKERRVRA